MASKLQIVTEFSQKKTLNWPLCVGTGSGT